MPVGINVEDDPVNPGFVLVEFVDPTLKGPAFQSLITAGGPDIIEPLTREKGSERKRYRIPSGNASAAGLIDGSGVALDDITQTGPADASGIVLPDPGTTHENIHAPVIRRGSYSLAEREGRDPNDNGTLGLVSPFAEQVDTPIDGEQAPADDPNVDGPDGYPAGDPSMDWRRSELNAYALKVKGIDTSNTATYPAKADVLNAINAAV